MLRNRAAVSLSVLQKTYDESYLTCSTAVYYESQGNEDEAMRCWRLALDQIYDHHVNRVLPNYTPRSETEKALVDSLRQLELQCKERIDLLEALRLSRHESTPNPDSSSSGGRPSKSSDSSDTNGNPQEKGWIGSGTIPAVTYTELSRPGLLKRPELPTRSSSEQAVVGDCGLHHIEAVDSPFASRPLLPPLPMPSPERKVSRSASPERHTMRTTLRPNRLGERTSSKTSLRRPSTKPADGPGASKAATLAWSHLSQKDHAAQSPGSSSTISLPNPSSPYSLEPSRKGPESSHKQQWDRHSRRLVSPGTRSPAGSSEERLAAESPKPSRHSDEYPFATAAPATATAPSSLSISAASNALSSMTLKDAADRRSPERERFVRQRTAPPQTPRRRVPRKDADEEVPCSAGDPVERSMGKKTFSDPTIITRKPVGQTPLSSASKGRSAASRSAPQGTTTTSTNNTPGTGPRQRRSQTELRLSSSSAEDSSLQSRRRAVRQKRKEAAAQREVSIVIDTPLAAKESDKSGSDDNDNDDPDSKAAADWKKRKAAILKKLPTGVDEHAAKQILNEIVVQGDEVHWGDIAGLEVAKNALRETVVYPFLRPDLFMGLREPARGMLLFGPPGTGKTMLARAVATESHSTFFSISASSLTSKYLGESEKLVRALFVLAKTLAPSIIFVDEIDSLLSQRSGSGEHEATRRIKTEFLIQWSDLQRAAAGREVTTERERERGDANRVLVLAATNLPWAIDEAARRRFVRRQYIPLPEAETRRVQIETLLRSQQHTLGEEEIVRLVGLTDGFSGSDITALAKDAAMGPLRSLGEALLRMTMDEIRPIELSDFVASLATIRPSVSKAGLKQYEDWAVEFGERGG
ncbi:P-loop containing nucleoside triphosphate hydrolase protein [Bombardia bombarda]|uniref:P-loop containing nucleoside triphosphate hydrolase protein n=1 Tax=Bombardia bombarda TaxID=252184 RepID=A0AA39TMF6_9PEZI|nr:P-loop containing nucleoside triphosphate hydrolase protein [Bombardia bombarda]